ncbi:MAG: phosphatase PAP2 family protein, partial [Armatimonadetes bacterium]|nr:phosphatase PAP2 family protein [Armatimonadota bacterium]
WAWFLLPLVIGYTRVYLGYHYPTDVVGGWAVGAVVAAFTLGLVRMAQRRLNCDCQPRAQEAASVPTNSDV